MSIAEVKQERMIWNSFNGRHLLGGKCSATDVNATSVAGGYPLLIEYFCFYLFSCSASLEEETSEINTTHMLTWSAKAKPLACFLGNTVKYYSMQSHGNDKIIIPLSFSLFHKWNYDENNHSDYSGGFFSLWESATASTHALSKEKQSPKPLNKVSRAKPCGNMLITMLTSPHCDPGKHPPTKFTHWIQFLICSI